MKLDSMDWWDESDAAALSCRRIEMKNESQFLETFFKQWYKKQPAAFKRTKILMQDNAPSHPSEDKYQLFQRWSNGDDPSEA